LSLINLFKTGILNNIAPNDLSLLISVVKSHVFSTDEYIQNINVDPMQFPVSSVSSKQALTAQLQSVSERPTLTITTTTEDSTISAYAKLNTPALLHRAPIMQKVMGTSTRQLRIADYLKFELLYFATKESNAKAWQKLIDSSEADVEFQSPSSDDVKDIQTSVAFQKVNGLSLTQMIDLYVTIYKYNLEDVVAIHDTTISAQAAAAPGSSASSAQDRYFEYNLQREQAMDIINAIGASAEIANVGVQAGEGWLNQILH